MKKKAGKRAWKRTGYRARIRALAAAGMPLAEVAREVGVRPYEVRLALALSSRRGRPLKRPTVRTVADVKRWRATQRPRTLRAAVECIDFLLTLLDRGHLEAKPKPRRTLVV